MSVLVPEGSCQIDWKRSSLPFDLEELRIKAGVPSTDVSVEIGFGNGDFLVHAACIFPEKIFVGFEVSGISVEKLIKRVRREKIKNVFCVREDAFFGLHFCFGESTLKEIYMNFPDPWRKKRHAKRRITSREKLILFHRKLKPEGRMIIRTDSSDFVDFTIEQADGIFSAEVDELRSFMEREKDKRMKVLISFRTKYMMRWESEGKKIYVVVLKKEKKSDNELSSFFSGSFYPDLPTLKMFLGLKVRDFPYSREEIEGQLFKLKDKVFARFFRVWEKDGNLLIETLLSEYGYEQLFYIKVERRGDFFLVDISPFSSVVRTGNMEELVRKLALGELGQ